jgi:hypothetical protein
MNNKVSVFPNTEKVKLVRYAVKAIDLLQADEPEINIKISIRLSMTLDPDGYIAKYEVYELLKRHGMRAKIEDIHAETVIEYELNPEAIIRECEFAGIK